jgi:hypothetical protein
VLAVQDTTELDFSAQPKKQGLGALSKKDAQGLKDKGKGSSLKKIQKLVLVEFFVSRSDRTFQGSDGVASKAVQIARWVWEDAIAKRCCQAERVLGWSSRSEHNIHLCL